MPNRSYLIGRSMGGLVALGMTERDPGQYDGVLPICGTVGGAPLAVVTGTHARAAFDFYYPSALPGNAWDVRGALGFGEALAAAQAAVVAGPAGALLMASEPLLDISAITFDELVANVAFRVAIVADGKGDMLSRTHGRIPVDTLDAVYDNPVLNAGIDRFVASPDARRYLEHNFEPSGHRDVPVLTVRNIRDPLVGMQHVVRLTDVVDAAGNSALLVHQTVDRFGHCSFKDDEVIGAMLDLVNWVENGVVPTPDDITVP